MDELQKNEFTENYDWALDNTPEEIRDFLWSDAYKGLIAGIAKTCNLTDAQRGIVSDALFDLVIRTTDEEEVRKRLTDAGIDEDVQTTIFSLGYDYIISLSAAITEQAIVDGTIPEDGAVATNQIVAPIASAKQVTPAAFAAMQQRLQSPSITTGPVQGDYTAPAPAAAAVPEKPAIDPYHEAIDNE